MGNAFASQLKRSGFDSGPVPFVLLSSQLACGSLSYLILDVSRPSSFTNRFIQSSSDLATYLEDVNVNVIYGVNESEMETHERSDLHFAQLPSGRCTDFLIRILIGIVEQTRSTFIHNGCQKLFIV